MKKIMSLKFIILLIFLLIFVGIGYIIFSKNNKDNIKIEFEVIDEKGITDIDQNIPPVREPKIYLNYIAPENDLDMDGVDDEKEKELGSSNETSDTDGDGLTDKLEIEKFGTDPTKSDTDGDGYSDGNEIINGYNPLGPGKLENKE